MKQILRPYQAEGLAKVLAAYRDGARSVLMVLPTGGGKTSIFASLANDIVKGGRRAVVLVHRRELAGQAANRFREFDTDFGFIMAGERPKPYAKVQIASVQTLIRRKIPPADLVIADEAHLSTAKTWSTILDSYPNARILGVTATPWRMSGKPLSGAYDACVVVARPAELRDQGFLCGYNGFSYLTPDLSDVKTVGGEYNEKQSAEAMRAPSIVDNVVEQWLAHASELSTVVFNVTVEHSLDVTARFKAAGVKAEHIDGKTPLEQRKAILKRVASGETRVLCNVGIAVEGLDIPRLKCCVLNRPTKSKTRAIQMMGRVRRPWNDVVARIHDHAFNIKLHGLPDADHDYTLSAKPERPPNLTTCELCLALYSGPQCPACNHENEAKIRGEVELVTVADAEKFEFSSSEAVAASLAKPPVDVQWIDIGRVIEGVFEKQWEENTAWGIRKRYLVRGAKRHYSLPGTADLNAKMARVPLKSTIRVTYGGERQIGGAKTKKDFKVEVDDGKGAARAEGRRLYEQGGKSFKDVSEAVRICLTTLRAWARADKWKVRPSWRAPNPRLVKRARQHYESEGKTLKEVGDLLEVSRTTIKDWAEKGCWKIRGSADLRQPDRKLVVRARELFENGKSAREIGQIVNRSSKTICSWALSGNWRGLDSTARRKPKAHSLRLRARALYEKNMSFRDVGRILRVSDRTVSRWAVSDRWVVRSFSESVSLGRGTSA